MKRFLLGVLVLVIVSSLLVGAALISWSARSSSSRDTRATSDHMEKGAAYLRQHLYRAAIQEFEAVTKKSPGTLDGWLGLAAVYIRLGDGRRALEGAGKAVSLVRDSPEVQLILGRAHWLAHDLEDAERAGIKGRALDASNLQFAELLLHVYLERHEDAKFEKLLAEIKEPSRPIQDLAVQFAIRRGEFRRAYDLRCRYERQQLEGDVFRTQLALKRENQRTELYPSLVRNLVKLGRVQEALAAGRGYKGNLRLDLELGKANWLAGNREEAIRAFERASAGITHKLSAEAALAALTGSDEHWREAFRAERMESDSFVLAQLGDLLPKATTLQKALIYRYAGLFDGELFNRSAEAALEVLKTEPDQFDALMTLGTAYLRLNRIDDAIRYVRQGGDRYPERAEVWARLGQLSLAKGDTAGAQPLMEKAVQLAPKNPSYLYNYGWLLDQLGRDPEASTYYERAIAASAASFEAMNNLALLEADAGRPERSLLLLSQAVDSNPESDAAYINRANYHAGRKAWSEALADYARAAELNPENGYSRVESARTHLELGRVDIALEELNEALDMDPNLVEAYKLLAAAYKKDGLQAEAAAALEEAKRVEGPGK